jgi:hypothetical protein
LRLGAALVLLVALSSASIAIARRSGPTFAVSDEALIELSTFNALEGHQRLGPYSRYAWHHPGPLLFYALAPFYKASGLRSQGLAAGARLASRAGLWSGAVGPRLPSRLP